MTEHSYFSKEEERDGFLNSDAEKEGSIPEDIYSWIVKHFSHPGDHVIDLLSTKGNCTVAAMKNFRNSAYFGTDKDKEVVRGNVVTKIHA